MYVNITLKYNNLYIYMSDQICYKNCDITTEVTDLITKAKKLKESGEKYQENGDINGAIYSYSNCSSILYTIKTLFEKMCKNDNDEMNKHLFFEDDIFLSKLENNYQDILNTYSASTEEETFKIINTKIEEVAKTLVDKGIPDRTACEAGLISVRPGFKDKKYMTVVDPNYHTIYSFDQNLNDVTPYLDPNQKNPIPIITGKESDLVPTGRIKDFVNLSQFDQYKWVTAMKKLSKKFEDVTDEDWKSITDEDKKNYPVTVNELFSVLGSTTVYPQIFSTEPGKIKLYGGDKYPEGKNKFDIAFLKTLNGTLLSNAIHRMLNKPERVQAFANAFKRTSKLDT